MMSWTFYFPKELGNYTPKRTQSWKQTSTKHSQPIPHYDHRNPHLNPEFNTNTNHQKPLKRNIFPWFSHDFPIIFPWFSHVFPMVFPMVFPRFSQLPRPPPHDPLRSRGFRGSGARVHAWTPLEPVRSLEPWPKHVEKNAGKDMS